MSRHSSRADVHVQYRMADGREAQTIVTEEQTEEQRDLLSTIRREWRALDNLAGQAVDWFSSAEIRGFNIPQTNRYSSQSWRGQGWRSE